MVATHQSRPPLLRSPPPLLRRPSQRDFQQQQYNNNDRFLKGYLLEEYKGSALICSLTINALRSKR